MSQDQDDVLRCKRAFCIFEVCKISVAQGSIGGRRQAKVAGDYCAACLSEDAAAKDSVIAASRCSKGHTLRDYKGLNNAANDGFISFGDYCQANRVFLLRHAVPRCSCLVRLHVIFL